VISAATTRLWLIAVTLAVVISDSMLMPFYPQLFAERFEVRSPSHVGLYIAAVCLTAMVSFPLWARVAKGRRCLPLLIWTQLAAGLLSVACASAPSLPAFWAISLGMIFFKGSYLLIYPHLMALADSSAQEDTIGVLTVLAHFGTISGALAGGLVLQLMAASDAFLVMACADFAQAAVCAALVRAGSPEPQLASATEAPAASAARTPGFVYRLAVAMFVFCLSAFATRPFFVQYWASISALRGEIACGLVYSIPGWMALAALLVDRRRGAKAAAARAIVPALLAGALGLALQAQPVVACVLAGRAIYGWALFRTTVRMELRLFELSRPERYATDFSVIHVAQNLGALVASSLVGFVVADGLELPLLYASAGFVVCALVYWVLLGRTTPGRELALSLVSPALSERS
jgi:DHA1 family multidrug resistance protein-like MFS transporter